MGKDCSCNYVEDADGGFKLSCNCGEGNGPKPQPNFNGVKLDDWVYVSESSNPSEDSHL